MSIWIASTLLLVVYRADQCYCGEVDDSPPVNEPAHPVVLVNGIGGAQLTFKLNGKPEIVNSRCVRTTSTYDDLWYDKAKFNDNIQCAVDNLRTVYNKTTCTSSSMPGVDIEVPHFGDIVSMEWLDRGNNPSARYFTDIVEMLYKKGYRRGESLMGAPYDWRKDPSELTDYYAQLKSLTETAYEKNGNKTVVIVSHGTGSPVMLYFFHWIVDQAWKDKYIKSLVSISGAWAGSVRTLIAYASGDNMGQDYLSANELRKMQRTWTASAFMLPNHKIFGFSKTLARKGDKEYSLRNLDEFFIDIGYESGKDQYTNAKHTFCNHDAPNVEVHCVHGTEVQTPEGMYWTNEDFPNNAPVIYYGYGDGFVNLESLELCSQWINKNGGKSVDEYKIPGVDHINVLKNRHTLRIIDSVAHGRSPPSDRAPRSDMSGI